MWLLLMRHGTAENPEHWAGHDEARPLTQKGRTRSRRAARALERLGVHVDCILTSPLARARQTAEILGGAMRCRVEQIDALSDSFGLDALAQVLMSFPSAGGLLLVGHEPDISSLVGALIGEQGEGHIVMRKGACACLDLDDGMARSQSPDGEALRGAAVLNWLLTGRQLAHIGAPA